MRRVDVGHQLGGRLEQGGVARGDLRRLVPGHAGRRLPGLVVGLAQALDDGVDGLADRGHGGRQLVPGRPQLLDLEVEGPAALGGVGQDPAAGVLGLLDHGPTPVPGLGHQPLAVLAGTVPEGGDLLFDALAQRGDVVVHLLTEGSAGQLALGDAGRGHRFGLDLDLPGLLVRLAQGGRRALLSRLGDPRRLFVGVAEHLGALLAQGGGQGGLVDHRVGRPLLGRGDRLAHLLLPALPGPELLGQQVEVGPDLRRVEAPPDGAEGVAGDVGRVQP